MATLLYVFFTMNVLILFVVPKLNVFSVKTKYHLLLAEYMLLAETVIFMISRYLWQRLTAPVSAVSFQRFRIRSVVALTFRIILSVVVLLSQISMLVLFHFAGTEPSLLSIVAGNCFVLVMALTTVVFTLELITFISWAVTGWPQQEVKQTTETLFMNSRKGFSSSLEQNYKEISRVFLAVALSIFCFGFAVYNGSSFPEVKYLRIPIKGLPKSFNNTVIVQLSDLHIGVVNGKSALKKVVGVANSLSPHIITGDVAEGPVNKVKEALRPLEDLKAEYGVYITTGNHDYYTAQIDEWLAIWQSQRLIPLHNTKKLIKANVKNSEDKFYLIGLDDSEGKFFRGEHHGPDYEKALGNRDPSIPTILLCHRPTVVKNALLQYGNIQLALSGHTHGGQFLPTCFWHYLVEPFFSGLYHYDKDSYVYVSNGVFYWVSQARIYNKGEITHITLLSN